eukprot:Gb_06170 [translate_table: standard]
MPFSLIILEVDEFDLLYFILESFLVLIFSLYLIVSEARISVFPGLLLVNFSRHSRGLAFAIQWYLVVFPQPRNSIFVTGNAQKLQNFKFISLSYTFGIDDCSVLRGDFPRSFSFLLVACADLMADAEVNDSTVALLQRLREEDSATHVEHYSSYTKLTSLFIGILLPVLLSMLLMNKKKGKPRGVPVEIGADPGFTIRNSKFPTMVESPWEGATTLAALFEQACKRHAHRRLLGSRKLISRDIEVSEDGRRLEKLHLGNYEWLTYAETFERVCNFASGLVKLGHQREERAAIFAETREEWLIALHVSL